MHEIIPHFDIRKVSLVGETVPINSVLLITVLRLVLTSLNKISKLTSISTIIIKQRGTIHEVYAVPEAIIITVCRSGLLLGICQVLHLFLLTFKGMQNPNI